MTDMQWCKVPEGDFLFGSDDGAGDEKPQQTIRLKTYHIMKYPVTNAQYALFVEAGGYKDGDWWCESDNKLLDRLVSPHYWDDPDFNRPQQPVVGICLFEALAYAKWLSAQLGYEVRLPSEAEWEKAARGTDGRRWPWGNTWDVSKANTDHSGLKKTTDVGSYPQGASPYGVLDMTGNVWEWTGSMYTRRGYDDDCRDNDYYHVTSEPESETLYVFRGGSWHENAHCAYRGCNTPYKWANSLGFRLVTKKNIPYTEQKGETYALYGDNMV